MVLSDLQMKLLIHFMIIPKKELLDEFESELWRSIDNKISLNPILNSFQNTVNKYSIPKDLIRSFLDSMKMDLKKRNITL